MEVFELKRKPGRPAKFTGVKRQNFSFRLTEEMRQRLIDSATASGRSLSEEIEFRLNRDLQWEEMFATWRKVR